MEIRTQYQSTSRRRLNHDLPVMKLWHKAKQLGVWDPQAIDFSQDRRDWLRLEPLEQDVILRLSSLFQAGEEAVTLDLLPLIEVIAREGRLEEEMYLTSFLWEEAKHVEAFRRFLDEVAGDDTELGRYHTPCYRRIFYEALPEALDRLRHDPSPVAQAEASVTYNLVVEGVLAETGYHAYYEMLRRNALMPGMQTVVDHLKRDESRHLAYGVFLLSRLVAEHGEPVWNAIQLRMAELLEPALGIINETFASYEVIPFGLDENAFLGFATSQFQRRLERIDKARHQSLAELTEQGDLEATL
ncbi:MAG: R2-like ligand-binding oxidase [Planctomycetaceae bacterium]|nr:R2-like ligand-binding oxidase [Planctomycetaceae bacterium]